MRTRVDADRLHRSTKHGTPPAHPERMIAYRRLDPGNAPRPFKEYRGLTSTPLPREVVTSTLPATEVLSGRTGHAERLDASMVATLLFLSAGVTRMMGPPGRRTYFRTAMSAGNLHPVEVYVIVGEEIEGITAGVHHFSPLEFGLTQLRSGDFRGSIPVSTPLTVLLTGIPWRTTWKYGERGWRHLYWDAGTMLANMLAVAEAHGLPNRTLLGFDDNQLMRLLGIDGVNEMPLAVVTIGRSDGTSPPSAPTLEPLSLEVAPVAPSPVGLPLLEEAQSGGTLSADQVESWQRRSGDVAKSVPSDVAPREGSGEPIEQVVLRRGSTRRMLRRPVQPEQLDWPIAAATRATGIDATGGGTLLDHYVNAHAVEGRDSGAYLLEAGRLELLHRTALLRQQSSALCLGQALGGDSAYTVFHCAELDPTLDALGSRGYRVAQLESGIVSGRLALCAFAMRLGATGLTFSDDAVSRFFGTSAQPMLVTSVGVPATSSAPSGSPGDPVLLER